MTTAEEFLHAATEYPDALAGILAVDRRRVKSFAEAAAAAIGAEEAEAILDPAPVHYPYRTGHDAPAEGRTFWNGAERGYSLGRLLVRVVPHCIHALSAPKARHS